VTPPERERESVGIPTAFHESHISVTRTARYLTAGPPGNGAAAVWFALHGYGQLARRFARQIRPLADGHRLLVVPEALSRFYLDGPAGKVGASWMTKEDRTAEIGDYVRHLDAILAAVDPPRDCPTIVFGFSQGVATACRWAIAGDVRPTRLILWAGSLPPDLPWPTAAKRLRNTRVTFVNGKRDASMSRADVLKQRDLLRARDVESDERWFTGGHEIDPDTLLELAAEDERRPAA